MKQEIISKSNSLQLPTEIVREILKHLIQRHSTTSCASNTSNDSSCQYMLIKEGGLYPSVPSRTIRNGMYEHEHCICWLLNILSASMVCRSWHSVGLEMIRTVQTRQQKICTHNERLSWISLVNQPTHQRTYPFRTRLISILKESSMANLSFHKQVRHLVIDFASFDSFRRERQAHSNAIIKKFVHNAAAIKEVTDLLELCIHIERLEVVCDAGLALLTPTISRDTRQSVHNEPRSRNCIFSNSVTLQQFFTQHPHIARRIKRLDFIGFRPDQRCPCCAGKGWDQYLTPFLSALTSIETITLRNVLPTAQVFQTLSKNPNLRQINFHRAMVTLPMRKRKNMTTDNSSKVQAAAAAAAAATAVVARKEDGIDEYVTSIQQIPAQLWLQVKSIKIYENIEDVTIQKCRKYLNELALSVGSQLEEFILQFGTKQEEQEEKYRELAATETIALQQQEGRAHSDISAILAPFKPNSPLFKLKVKCKDSLKHILLINVPENLS